MAKLIINPGTPLVHEVDLKKSHIVMGRSPEVDVQIHHGTVSSRHCELIVSDIAVVVRDLGSTNGSFVNEQRIEKAVLQTGQILRLGDVKMLFELGDVHIRVPEREREAEAASVTLEDGQLSCLNHLEIPGSLECVECRKVFCESCVRIVPRLSGGALRFCPNCSNAMCHPYVPAYLDAHANRKTSLTDWLQKGMRVFTRRK
ncbi:MAG: FHA domain-containing protein [Verrucomicrobiales bacterium]